MLTFIYNWVNTVQRFLNFGCKSEIVTILKNSSHPVSGEILGKQLGVSRVAVWKQVKSLKNSGYPIFASSEGYLLQGEVDLLCPWEFPGRESFINHFTCVDSTMTIARQLAEKDTPDGTVITADRQINGKGRLNRPWISEEGGLYFTLVLRPKLPLNYAYLYSCAAAVSAVKTLEEHCGIQASVKWPNDVFVKDRKIAGVLIEVRGEFESIHYLNLGVGMNLNNTINKPLAINACSVKSLTGKTVSRKDFLVSFLFHLESITKNFKPDNIIRAWSSYSSTLRRKVSIHTSRGTIHGTAISLCHDGGLVIQTTDGKRKAVYSGDCLYRKD
ncbi:MAG: biotin--[acetyl-CoA-carboxylase] ligase [Spirochaetota bacterium]